ncbi:ABC transporter permease [Hathewaya histolytica]|uniref:ABC transporter permease n=1 Tax=Hathewaya histolytica TaxID=1498 RepID=A0A4V6KD08_HATHI|nr:ABC transporter permease [Hathewaya histolytica]VTQ82887.1 ABC transporter permease [Hathewaya histolytica]
MQNKNVKYEIVRTLVAIGLSLLLAFILIFAVSKQPVVAINKFLLGPLKSVRHFSNVLEMAIPLIFTGLAVSIMYQAKQFNLGAEGAFFIGGIGASIIAIQFKLPIVAHPIVAILFGAILGAVAGLIPAILKAKYKATELVSSLMLNYVLFYIGIYIINNVLRDPNAGSMASVKFNRTAQLTSNLIPKTRLHTGLFIVILMVIVCYFFIYRTKWGYEIRMTGENERFARYSGVNTFKVILLSQVIGGAIAGMGGATEVLGMYSRFQWQSLPGYGWDGVIVAILARNNPLLVPIGAVFLAYLRVGADLMNRMTDVQSEVIAIIQGIMIMLIAAERFLAYWKHKRIYKNAKSSVAGNTATTIKEKGEH